MSLCETIIRALDGFAILGLVSLAWVILDTLLRRRGPLAIERHEHEPGFERDCTHWPNPCPAANRGKGGSP